MLYEVITHVVGDVGLDVAERVRPYRPRWNQPRGDLLADALYLPTTPAVAALMRPLVAAVGVV